MKVVHHERYREVYASDPAAQLGRIESVCKELQGHFEFVTPEPASEQDILLTHVQNHVENVKTHTLAYEIALLAVGGAVKASEIAVEREPAFGLIRPPGHHASRDSSWGFCYFNNIAVSIEKLRRRGRIGKAVVVDIDLHYGDGTANIFAGEFNIAYFHVSGVSRESYLNSLSKFLKTQKGCDIVGVSAGFDGHQQDWGRLLTTSDYFAIGKMIKEFACRECGDRRYAVLEGGYNHAVLGKNVKAFLQGME